MRNEKKYNKSIYFTMVFVQTIIHLVVLSEIFLKLFLIDHIVYDASSKIIIMDFIWIIILFYEKLVDCLEKCLIYGHIRRFAN